MQWVGRDGTVRSGHAAVAAALGTAGRGWRAVGRLLVAPGVAPIAARVYRIVAANRSRLPAGRRPRS